MSVETRAQAETQLRQVAQAYNDAAQALRTAESAATAAVQDAKRVGLSQHDIARIMGPVWGAEHNPQYPPVLDLQRPPTPPASAS